MFTPTPAPANPIMAQAQPRAGGVVYQGIYRTALALHAAPGTALGGLQGEARRRLPTAHLLPRVAVTAIRS